MNWQVLEERLGNIAQVQTVYSPGYVDALVLRDRDVARDGDFEERLYVSQDANWNVTSVVNVANAVVERYTYDVYGSMTVLSPTWVTLGGSAFGWNIGHQGGRFEILVGLYHQRNRDYSPTLQTWVSMDPIFTSTNWYVAYGNNPVNAVDPWGLQPVGHISEEAAMRMAGYTPEQIREILRKRQENIVKTPIVVFYADLQHFLGESSGWGQSAREVYGKEAAVYQVTSMDSLAKDLKRHVDASIKRLIFGGHGTGGCGIRLNGGYITAKWLMRRPDVVELIKSKLASDGYVEVQACSAARSYAEMQTLSNLFGRRIYAQDTDSTNPGSGGWDNKKYTWYYTDPTGEDPRKTWKRLLPDAEQP